MMTNKEIREANPPIGNLKLSDWLDSLINDGRQASAVCFGRFLLKNCFPVTDPEGLLVWLYLGESYNTADLYKQWYDKQTNNRESIS